MAIAALPYSISVAVATVTITARQETNFSDIFGVSLGQAQNINEIIFNGTAGDPATLVIDANPSGSPLEWNFSGNDHRINIASSREGVVKINDGITVNISGHTSTNSVNVGSNASLTFDMGAGSVINFNNSNVYGGGAGIYHAGKEIVLRVRAVLLFSKISPLELAGLEL